jgi:hypothetical protein
MRIGTIDVKISVLAIAVAVIFLILLIAAYLTSGQISLLTFGIPVIILLIVIPMALNYMSQVQYIGLIPEYERMARPVRVRMINESLLNQVVRLEVVVEKTHFQFLNRPQFMVADRSGEISVKMFTSSQEPIRVNDIVEVLGTVIRRYIFYGDLVINAVSIRKIDKKIEIFKDSSQKVK